MQPLLRDTRKLKDKLELIIDPRQIALLVIGEVLLLILVFTLGFAVGRSRYSQPKLEPLVREPVVQGEILAQTHEQSLSQTELVEIGMPPHEADLQALLEEKQEAVDEQKVYQIDLTKQESLETSQSQQEFKAKQLPTTEQKVENLKIEETSSKRIEEATEEPKQKPLIIPKPPEPLGFSRTSSNRCYTVQVAAFDTKEQASAFADMLKQRYALDAYVTEGKAQGKTWYRVRIGKFEDLQKAKDFAKVLEGRLGVKPFIDLTSE